ncbi:helicase SNF2 (plasmid) [Rhizobium ruizarguesonis]|uniref:DEAD/DEAH box helicase n=1 Tax=Rhizobium ruizarguesonis TaxID=2081791 RepID=UPI0010323D82|nr:helicase-related protein [Rhizobium ruizarguesonis]TBB60054.1 helicase SNF2 [Rhizobium ruizarguesonis]
MTKSRPLEAGIPVHHPRHGNGRVVVDMGDTIVVRFGGNVEQVLAAELVEAQSLQSALRKGLESDPTDTVLRAQALAIRSVNDQWGVFSRSRVQLLPHQLWVCRQVTQEWPFRWLVADDVGLGKTIECGLVLMPLIGSGRVRRVLILAPAKLVPQWQFRLKDMFDIRLQRYVTDADTERGDFWATASMVVASFHTLRDDRRGARQRLLEADPWDLVIVDEAHHLGVDEKTGETLAYSLVSGLQERGKINSLLFFTGTPHRGKDYGFLGLMRLVRPDLFDPEKDSLEQLSQLPKVMLRNNKATVTDLQGNKLFKPVNVYNREYQYSEQETRFYRTLSEFVIDGRAYAATLDGRAQTARMLVLITLQKLAASSIAAIRNALRKRRAMLVEVVKRSNGLASISLPDEDATLDDLAEAEEALPGSADILLTEDEIQRLDDLINLADKIGNETKVERLLQMIGEEFEPGEPILLFTEYKASQALIVNALHQRFGYGSATFINGDERLDGLVQASSEMRTTNQPREQAAAAFNAGKVRFLVSTEAGGEGIDLQERCAVLVHADMPWNPMRLHQRVGRLSRYGQTRPVSVYILRNPQTVEARIWDLLNAKLERIQVALSSVMEEREDISQLVIGMAGNSLFNELFSGSEGLAGDRLGEWFDRASATLGGRDVVETVRDLLGNVSKFDFQQVGKDLPKVDLPDLERFFTQTVSRHGRRIYRRDDGLEIKTPDEWKTRSYVLRDKYDGLVFDRGLRGTNSASRVLGVGHPLFDVALDEAQNLSVSFASISGLPAPLLVISVEDEVTGTGALVHRLVFGVTFKNEEIDVLRDWELLQLLNRNPLGKVNDDSNASFKNSQDTIEQLKRAFDTHLSSHAPSLRRPVSWPIMLLFPEV